jgi:hypothetical protein
VVTFGAVKEREYTLLEQGEYVLTLNDLEESEGQWGPRLVWKFLAAPKEDATAYIVKPSGDEYELWAFTDREIILGSLSHEFAQTLSGRTLTKDDAPPDEDDLLGKRLIAYVTHETPTRGKNAGKKREAIVAGSIKPYRGSAPAKTIAKNVERPAAPANDEERAGLIRMVDKAIGKAVKLESPRHLDWIALDTASLADDALRVANREIEADIAAALEA